MSERAINAKFQNNIKILGHRYGQLNSIAQNRAVDESNREIPWYTYPAIEYLDSIDFSNSNVLEYGSGNSSVWWASKAKFVFSVEHDKNWFLQVRNSLKRRKVSNHTYLLADEKNDYVTAADGFPADIVVIDGILRRACISHQLSRLAQGQHAPQILVFDNSDWWPSTVAFFKRRSNWIQVDFSGLGPINDYTWTTSVFFNPATASDLQYSRSPRLIGALMQIADDDA
jgi:hypothetical protein